MEGIENFFLVFPLCEKHFKSFGYILREIQVSKVLALVLKSISFESDNSLWSSSIELKFWTDIEDINFMRVPKFQGVWSCWERVVSHFVFRSQFEVTSRKKQDLSFYEVKWVEILRNGNRHNFSCFKKISKGFKVICEWCSFGKLLW
jgi:hypothetical protein